MHTPEGQRKTFERLFTFLKPRGAYYIEDVWMLDKIDMNHPWIKSHTNDFTMEKYNKLIEVISKYNVTHHDFSSKKIPDSFILKIRK